MKNAIVIFGGKSFEHDISIITTLLVKNKTKGSEFKLHFVYINKDNEWFFYSKDNLRVECFKNFNKTHKKDGFLPCFIKPGSNTLFIKNGLHTKKIKIDAALNCCHGGIGENGALVGLFECSNIAISSGDIVSMSVGMDKIISKFVYDGLNIKNIKYKSLSKSDYMLNKENAIEEIEKLIYPLIIKPARLGSSIGIKIAKTKKELEEGLEIAFEFDSEVLIEKAILNMQEYNVACMRYKSETLVSEVDKPIKHDEILSFKDKYIGDCVPSKRSLKGKGGAYLNYKKFEKVDEELSLKLKEISKKIYEKLNMVGVVRIDFIVSRGNIYLNEVNTVPGSLGYYFFCPSKFKTFSKFIDALLNEAIENKEENNKIKKEFISNIF